MNKLEKLINVLSVLNNNLYLSDIRNFFEADFLDLLTVFRDDMTVGELKKHLGISSESESDTTSIKQTNVDSFRWIDGDLIFVEKNDLIGAINKSGDIIIPIKYTNIIKSKDLYICKYNNYYGVIDKTNNIVISFKYDDICEMFDNFKVTLKNKCGIISRTGVVIFDSIHYRIETLNEYYVLSDGNNYCVAKKDGTIIISYSDNYTKIRDINFGYICAVSNEKYGVVDFDRNVIIPFKYININIRSSNVFEVKNTKSTKYINSKCKEINIFVGVFLIVSNILFCKNSKYGAIDSNNNVIIPFDYDNIYYNGDDYIYLYNDTNVCVFNKKTKTTHIVNNNNYHKIERYCDTELFSVCVSSKCDGSTIYKYGIINITGNIILPIEYSSIYSISIVKDDKRYIINENFETILELDKSNDFGYYNNKFFKYNTDGFSYLYDNTGKLVLKTEDMLIYNNNFPDLVIIEKRKSIKNSRPSMMTPYMNPFFNPYMEQYKISSCYNIKTEKMILSDIKGSIIIKSNDVILVETDNYKQTLYDTDGVAFLANN